MTLSQWVALAGITPTHQTTERGAVSVVVSTDFKTRWTATYSALWRLDDYAVSSVCGAVIWLVPRAKPAYCPLCCQEHNPADGQPGYSCGS